MSKGTILYVGGFELPDKNAAAHRVISNGKLFQKVGYDMLFLDVSKTNRKGLFNKGTFFGFETWSIAYPENKREWMKYLTDITHIQDLIELNNDIKIIIAYNFPSIALYKLIAYSKQKGIKLIGDCTEWYTTKGNSFVFNIIKMMDTNLRMRVFQKKMDGLIVISRYLEKYYTGKVNVLRLPPLVDINDMKWLAHETNQINDKIRCVYSGTIGVNKDDIDQIIDLLYEMNMLKTVKFEIVGVSKSEYVIAYPRQTEIINETENIIFHGRKSHVESLNILKQADFSIIFRRSNLTTNAGFSTKFVECTTCGIPVITTDTSDIREYLVHAYNGILIDENFSANTQKCIQEVVENKKDILRRLKENAEECRDTFHFEKYFDETVCFLNKSRDF